MADDRWQILGCFSWVVFLFTSEAVPFKDVAFATAGGGSRNCVGNRAFNQWLPDNSLRVRIDKNN
jgi:hypothetical protein